MEIKIIERKKDFLDLLLLADEPESMIDKYLVSRTWFYSLSTFIDFLPLLS